MTLGSVAATGVALESAAAGVETGLLAQRAGEYAGWDIGHGGHFEQPARRLDPIQYRLPVNGALHAHRFAASAEQVLAGMSMAVSRFPSRVLQSPHIMSHTLPQAEISRIASDVVTALASEGRTAIVSTTYLDAGSTDDLDAAIKQRLRGTRTLEINGGELGTHSGHRVAKLLQALWSAYPMVEFKSSGRGDYFDLVGFLGDLKRSGVVSRRFPLTLVVNGYAPKTAARDDLFGLLRDIAQDGRSFPYVRVLVTTPFLVSGHGQNSWFGASGSHFFPQGQHR